MKPIVKKILVPGLSAVTGGLVVLAALELSPTLKERYSPHVATGPTKTLRHPVDPFAHMNKIEEEMESHMQSMLNHALSFDDVDSSDFAAHEITQREDDHYVYYDLKVEDPDSTTIETQVDNGQVSVSGTSKRTASSGNGTSMSSSSFSQSFPLPAGVDETKMETVTEQGKIILKFPKKAVI